MHLVPSLRRTQMREARSGHDHVRWILVIDRREHAPLFQRPSEIDRLADSSIGNELAERHALGDRLAREVDSRARALDQPALAARGDRKRSLAVLVDELRESQASAPSSAPELRRVSISSKMRGSVKLLAANVAPASISVRESSVVIMPTTARPAAAAARTPDNEFLEGDRMSRRRARALERCQIRQRIRLGTRNLPADHQDRQASARSPTPREPSRHWRAARW